jgi:hypothetical protein
MKYGWLQLSIVFYWKEISQALALQHSFQKWTGAFYTKIE